jgi:hypothetical protein
MWRCRRLFVWRRRAAGTTFELVYAERLACGDPSFAVALRDHYRGVKEWPSSDRVRDALQEAGFEVRDTPQGTQVVKPRLAASRQGTPSRADERLRTSWSGSTVDRSSALRCAPVRCGRRWPCSGRPRPCAISASIVDRWSARSRRRRPTGSRSSPVPRTTRGSPRASGRTRTRMPVRSASNGSSSPLTR